MAEWYQNLLEFASKEYDFDMNTFKVKQVTTWPDQEGEIYTFDKNGKEYIIYFEPDYLPQRRQTRAELDFIAYLAENNISVAAPLRTVGGELAVSARSIGEDYNITVFEFANGLRWDINDPNIWNDKLFFNWGKLMGDMHRLSKDYNPSSKYNVPDMLDRNYEGWGSYFDRLKVYPDVYKTTQKLLGELVALQKGRNSYGLIHCDMHQDNFFIDGDRINLFDFNDNIYGWFVLDIGIAIFHALWWGRKNDKGNEFTSAIIKNFLTGYLTVNHLSDFWLSKIPMFMKHRQICCFIPWFFDPEDMGNHHGQQKEWKYNVENDILFDGCGLKSISDIIENAIMNKLGRVIIIGGCPRAGKTTLSARLVKSGLGFSKISGDHLGNQNFDFYKTLLEGFINDAEAYGINSIFDYFPENFTLNDIEKLPFKDKLEMYFLGFPDISIEEIKYNISHYAKPADWIYHVDDDYVGVVAKRIYDFNIRLKEYCEKYSYRFVNTGVGKERSAILDSLYEEIISKTKMGRNND